jgi:hypothetical protein
MGLLPTNKPKKTVDTPRNYFIWGMTMHGKSYLASQFPNPVIFNTDGNANAIETPSVDLKNERDPKTGQIKFSVIEQLSQLIKELEQGNHGFETVVIDVVDDVVTLIENAICEENGVQYLGDMAYGKGWGLFKSMFTALVVKLKGLPMNVIYVSRYNTENENNIERPIPSLSVKHLNTVNGNCDLNILCQKVGKNYIRRVVDRRKAYQRDWIEDDRILSILDTVIGAFDKTTNTSKEEAKKIVEKLEETAQTVEKAAEEKEDKPKYTGTKCSVCGEPQFETTSGDSCKNGHGGAEPEKPSEPQPKTAGPRAPRPARIQPQK